MLSAQFLATPPSTLAEQDLTTLKPTEHLALTVQAQEAEEAPPPNIDNKILYSIFPDCVTASQSAQAGAKCLREVVTYVFFTGLGVFFIRIGYVFIRSIASPGSGGVYKSIRESIRDLVVGIVFIGMPVTIMSMVNPLSENLSLAFLREFYLGPEARLIDVSQEARGCARFNQCVQTCVNRYIKEDEREPCVAQCRSKATECDQECKDYVSDVGVIQADEADDYEECINEY